MKNHAYSKIYSYILIIFFTMFKLNTVQAEQFISKNLHIGNTREMELDFEPFRKINLSVSPKDDGKDCNVEVCMYNFHFSKLGQFSFPFPSTIRTKHAYENGKLTILLSQASDTYDGILEIQSCPRALRACKCSANPALQEISARKNLPTAVNFSASYSSSKFRCVNIISRYQWIQ